MGCISSKVLSRSPSVQDELDKRRRIFGSRKCGDQPLALICTSDKILVGSTNLDPINVASYLDPNPRKDVDPEVISSVKNSETGQPNPRKRSKSWHRFPDDETSSSNTRIEWKNIGIPRSRSSHKFYKLFERVRRLTTILNIGNEDCPVSISKEETDQTETSNDALAEEDTICEAEADTVAFCSPDDITNTREDAAREEHEEKKRLKWRSVSSRLDSLQIPTTIEFHAVLSLSEWLQGGKKTDSSETYATPKFGSYATSHSEIKSKQDNNVSVNIANPEIE